MSADILTSAIRGLYGVIFFLVPLILTPWNYELFEYNKMMATYGLTAIIAALFLVRAAREKSLAIIRTPLNIPLLIFFISQLISALYSTDPHISWFGYYSRFNGGVWSVISYLVLFFALGSLHLDATSSKPDQAELLNRRFKSVRTLFTGLLITGILVAVYGVLERLGIDKHLWVQDVQNRVFSTLGQPNWLAAYLVALIPITQAFMLIHLTETQPKPKLRFSLTGLFWAGAATLFFTTLLFTRSRSGLLAFAVSDFIFVTLVILTARLRRETAKKIGILHLAFALVVFVNGVNIESFDKNFSLAGLRSRLITPDSSQPPAETPPRPAGTLLEYGGTESGTIRKYVWQAAVTAWKSSTKTFLIGTGTETFAWTFFRFRPLGHNLVSEWDFLYNKAHNEYLNYLATTGLFGLGSYLTMLAAMGYLFFAACKNLCPVKTDKTAGPFGRKAIVIGAFAGWTSILITNFFGFSVVIIQILLFLLPLLAFLTGTDRTKPWFTVRLAGWRTNLAIFTALLGGSYLVLTLAAFWHGDTLFAAGWRQARNGLYVKAQENLRKAVEINPGEPLYRDELGSALAQLAVSLAATGDASGSSQLAYDALELNSQALTQSPANVNFWKTRTKIYYAFSELNPAFIDEAIKALETARELSPNDAKIVYNLAILENKKGDFDKAIVLMKESKTMKPNYRDSYYGLYAIYTQLGKTDEAETEIRDYLKLVDPNDTEFNGILSENENQQ